MGFLTENEIGSFLNIQSPTTEQAAWINTLNEGISKAIQNHCGRDLELTTYTETYDGNGQLTLKLKNYPIISVTSVTYTDTNGVEEDVSSDDYFVYADEGWLRLKITATHSSTWIREDQAYEIVYVAGYAALPDDIRLAALKWIATEFQKIEQKLHAIQSRGLGDETISYVQGKMPSDVEKLLERYVRPPYG